MDCELCNTRVFNYTCPRCNIKYCSLDCYRSQNHSQCSEAFYKECVVNELKSQQSCSDDKKNVLEMLQNIEAEDDQNNENEWEDLDSDDSNDGDLANRLDGIDLNNPDAIWEKLTETEKEEFKSIIYNGEIEKIVEHVNPWWNQKLHDKPVVDVEENEKMLEQILEKCPTILPGIKDFSKISTKKPAECIIYNIGNIIGTYCYIYRFYNGDLVSYELEASNNFISICDNLKSNANFDNLVLTVDSIMLNCHNFNLYADLSTKSLLLEDIHDIFNGPSKDSNIFLLSAISDVINLFHHARLKYRDIKIKRKSKSSKSFSSEFPAHTEECQNYSELKNQTHFMGCTKKLEFYLSFVKHCYNSTEWNADKR